MFLGAAVQSASGFGFSLVAVPLLSMLVGPKAAVVGVDGLGLGLTVSMAVSGRRHARTGTVRVVTAAGLLGMPIGLWILTGVGERALALVVSAVVLTLTAALIAGVRAPDRPRVDVVAGFASGVLATSTGTNGPPLVLALQSRRVPPAEFRATLAVAFAVQGVAALAGFAITRQFDADVARVVAVGIPGLVAGRLAGDRAFARLGDRRFRGVVLGLLLVAGLASLARAVLAVG